tara:strand:- start:1679 stop:1930 length:252 start_codon:yes stop_codon:yes gene_type:complete
MHNETTLIPTSNAQIRKELEDNIARLKAPMDLKDIADLAFDLVNENYKIKKELLQWADLQDQTLKELISSQRLIKEALEQLTQ